MLLTDDDARHLRLQRPDPGRILQNRLARGAQAFVGFDRHRARFLEGHRFLTHYPWILYDKFAQRSGRRFPWNLRAARGSPCEGYRFDIRPTANILVISRSGMYMDESPPAKRRTCPAALLALSALLL